jgi:LysM repeat protein
MNTPDSELQRKSRLRERHAARRTRRTGGSMAARHEATRMPRVSLPPGVGSVADRGTLLLRDALWYVTHTRAILLGLAGVVVVVALLFIALHVFAGQIFPNVWALGVNLGDKTVEEAAAALRDAWDHSITIELIDQDRSWQVTPADLGLVLDAEQTAEAARGAGMTGIPFGVSVTPVVNLDFGVAQTYLLDLTTYTDISARNAGYAWRDGQITGVPGSDGRLLNVPLMMERLSQDTATIAANRRLDLLMAPLNPTMADPQPYLADAQTFLSLPLTITGYDPFRDEQVYWSVGEEVRASWVEAGLAGLALRDDTFDAFITAQNQSLNPPDTAVRYLDPVESKEKMREAIMNGDSEVRLRIRYYPSTYSVESGDTAFRISRKTGIPYYLIEDVNAGRDLNQLYVDDVINLPSRDAALPLDPVMNKRIVVDLRTQTLMAFENDQLVFSWLISSGIDSAPTSPGVYQILSHDPVSYGSSYTLCGSTGCSQWKMDWFMGMYEVRPGLMNGFHGAVTLPNGTYLGGGNVGYPYTYGCVMSNAQDGKALYDWAEDGTVVEIVSEEFGPQSALAQQALANSS